MSTTRFFQRIVNVVALIRPRMMLETSGHFQISASKKLFLLVSIAHQRSSWFLYNMKSVHRKLSLPSILV